MYRLRTHPNTETATKQMVTSTVFQRHAKQAVQLGRTHEELLCKCHLFIQPPKERQDATWTVQSSILIVDDAVQLPVLLVKQLERVGGLVPVDVRSVHLVL